MKKSLFSLLISSALILSSCGVENSGILVDPSNDVIIQAKKTEKNQVNMTNAEIQKLINDNKQEIEKVAKLIYMSKFADESEVVGFTQKNAAINPAFKGGVIFNLLNKSEFARTLIYGIGKYAVKKKFAKPDIVDNFPVISQAQTNDLLKVLKAGDIILCGIDDSFIHSIVYEGNGSIIHALGSPNPKFWGVVKEQLETYFKRSNRDKFVVLRYKNASQQDIAKQLEFANKQVGKPYDSLFLLNDDDSFYCTELAFRSLTAMPKPPRVFPHKEKFGWELVANEDFMDSPDLETVWTLNRTRNTIGKINKY